MEKHTSLSTADKDFQNFSALMTCYRLLVDVSFDYEQTEGETPDPFKIHMVGSSRHAARLIASAADKLSQKLFPQPLNVETNEG